VNNFGRKSFLSLLFGHPLSNFILILLGMSAAYFTTIGSIRLQLAQKADSELVERIDKSLVRLEVLIREGTVGKDDFFKFSNEVESRLSRIESYLTDKPKGKI
jgi:hypothetical protein